MNISSTFQASPQSFPHTRWSVVLAARQEPSPQSAAALETICRAYWYPLYAYVRRSGQSPQHAQDLTQEFFCRLIEKGWLGSVDRAKGRLRTFLIVALKRFMLGEWRRASAGRRGGAQPHVSVDTAFAESHYAAEHNPELPPDQAFDRQWAIALHNFTLERLQAEFTAAGKPEEFITLKDCLMAPRGGIDYASIAAQMNLSEGAARVAVHRLRRRFRQIYREEIAHTLSRPEDIEAELRHLAQALGRT